MKNFGWEWARWSRAALVADWRNEPNFAAGCVARDWVCSIILSVRPFQLQTSSRLRDFRIWRPQTTEKYGDNILDSGAHSGKLMRAHGQRERRQYLHLVRAQGWRGTGEAPRGDWRIAGCGFGWIPSKSGWTFGVRKSRRANEPDRLALLTPGSYVSDICRAEQLRALRTKRCVIPVLAHAGTDIPLHLRRRLPQSGGRGYTSGLAQLLGISTRVRALPQRGYRRLTSQPRRCHGIT